MIIYKQEENMKILEDEGFCTACNVYGEYKYGEENYSFIKKNLDNYKKYKDIYVYKCPNCGFISTDISGEEGVFCDKIKDSYEYKQLLDYSYLKGLDKELYEYHSQDIMANLLEAYSLILLDTKNYEKYIRVVNRAIELKQIMKRKYKLSQDEIAGEDENDNEYEKLYELIDESIETNRKQIDYYYEYVENKDVFLKLIYVETLIGLNRRAEARKLYEEIIRKYKLSQDLKEYFENEFKIED